MGILPGLTETWRLFCTATVVSACAQREATRAIAARREAAKAAFVSLQHYQPQQHAVASQPHAVAAQRHPGSISL